MSNFISHDDDAFAWLLDSSAIGQQEQQQQQTHESLIATTNAIQLIPLRREPYVPVRDPLFAVHHDSYRPATSRSPDPQTERPSKIRKKPGPKPNPQTPALRKIQNRAAQRAFRARKEQHVKELEQRIEGLKSSCKAKDAALLLANQDNRALKAECYYLKGMALTLLLVCLHHDILIPDHFPYISSGDILSEYACKSPYAIDAYLESQRQYEEDMQELVLNIMNESSGSADTAASSDHNGHEDKGDDNDGAAGQAAGENSASGGEQLEEKKSNEDHQRGNTAPLDDRPGRTDGSKNLDNRGPTAPEVGVACPVEQEQQDCALTDLFLQFKIQSKLLRLSAYNRGLQPTYLQLLVPHDVRIDMVPNPYLRDRFIIFRSLVDMERVLGTLLDGSRFVGDDPTSPGDWELPVKFLQEYWFICMKYRHRKVQGWDQLERLVVTKPELIEAIKDNTPTKLHFGSGELYKEGYNEITDDTSFFDDADKYDMAWLVNNADDVLVDNDNQELSHNVEIILRKLYAHLKTPPGKRTKVESLTVDACMKILNFDMLMKI